MSTIQIVGIAVAAVIVVLLVVGLIVTRKPDEEDVETSDESQRCSLFDTPPSDTLAKLGAPEYVPAEPPVAGDATTNGRATTSEGGAPGSGTAMSGEIDLDWGERDEPPAVPAKSAPAGRTRDDAETTDDMTAVKVDAEAPVGSAEPVAEPASEATPAQSSPKSPAAEGSEPQASASRLVPLSSIIVTTSTKMVDLGDPEIRRMLTELVTFEIDQATQFRAQGQDLDAILQLTEAEKICRAIGREDTARQIHDMMQDLRA